MKQYLSTEQIQKEIETCLQGNQTEEGPTQIDLTKSLEQSIKQDLSGKHHYKLEKFQVLKTAENIFRKKEKLDQKQNHDIRFSAQNQLKEELTQPEDFNQSEAQHKQSVSSEIFMKENSNTKYKEIMQDPEFQQVYKVYPDNITKNILIYMPQNETNQHKFQPRGNKERLQEIKDINQQIRKLQKNILKEYEEMFKQEEQEQDPENFEFITNIPGQKQESPNDSIQEKVEDENAETPEQEQLINLTKPIIKQPFKQKKQKIYINFEDLKKQQFQNIFISTASHKVPQKGRPMNSVEHKQRVFNKENTKTYPYNFVIQL